MLASVDDAVAAAAASRTRESGQHGLFGTALLPRDAVRIAGGCALERRRRLARIRHARFYVSGIRCEIRFPPDGAENGSLDQVEEQRNGKKSPLPRDVGTRPCVRKRAALGIFTIQDMTASGTPRFSGELCSP